MSSFETFCIDFHLNFTILRYNTVRLYQSKPKKSYKLYITSVTVYLVSHLLNVYEYSRGTAKGLSINYDTRIS